MGAVIPPLTLLLIILAGYLCKRARLFGPKDYRVVQTAEFNLILPGAIIYSFATNPHNVSLLWVSGFALIITMIPPMLIFFATRHHEVGDRAFLMLNGTGFNIGCFCFPILQALLGPSSLVPAAMFDIGNCVMVAAGTNVLTQSLLRIRPGMTLAEQHGEGVSILPHVESHDSDARRLRRRATVRRVAKGFFSSAALDVYLLMIALMIANVQLPAWVATVFQPFSAANAFCAMLLVGMLMDLPANGHDLRNVLEVLAWRIPCAIAFAAAAWFLLPFDPLIRETVALCCFAPTAVFSTMFTDKVLGNAKLAGFTLSITAVISIGLTTAAHFIIEI